MLKGYIHLCLKRTYTYVLQLVVAIFHPEWTFEGIPQDDPVCVYVCMYVCMYANVCICNTYMDFWARTAEWHGVCVYMCMYVCAYVRVHITYMRFEGLQKDGTACMVHVCMYICVRVCLEYMHGCLKMYHRMTRYVWYVCLKQIHTWRRVWGFTRIWPCMYDVCMYVCMWAYMYVWNAYVKLQQEISVHVFMVHACMHVCCLHVCLSLGQAKTIRTYSNLHTSYTYK
jgi:hypothetical protein